MTDPSIHTVRKLQSSETESFQVFVNCSNQRIKLSLQAIYEMLGPEVAKSADDSPRKRAKMIFEKMDANNDKASFFYKF